MARALTAAEPPALLQGVVHAWAASLDPPLRLIDDLSELLSPDEVERASRFVFPHLGRRFIAGRAFLRLLLGSYLGRPAASLRFAYSAQGRPSLEGDGGGIRFNLAHSHELAVCAVARAGDLGVDVEHERPLASALDIAQSYFSPLELEDLTACAEDEQVHAFFELWTLKEAVLKATGEGLSRPLRSFAVSRQPGSRPIRLAHGESALDLFLYRFDPEPGYLASVAVSEASAVAVGRWSWEALRSTLF